MQSDCKSYARASEDQCCATVGSTTPNRGSGTCTHLSPYHTRLQCKIHSGVAEQAERKRSKMPRPSEKQIQLKNKSLDGASSVPSGAELSSLPASVSRRSSPARPESPYVSAQCTDEFDDKPAVTETAQFQFSPAGSGTSTPNAAFPYAGLMSSMGSKFTPETPQITPGESPSVSPHFKSCSPIFQPSVGYKYANLTPSFAAVTAGNAHKTFVPPPITPRGIRSAFRANFAAARNATHESKNESHVPPPLYPQQSAKQQGNGVLLVKENVKPNLVLPNSNRQPLTSRLPRQVALPSKAIGDLFGNISHEAMQPDFDKQRQRRYQQTGATGRQRWRNDSIP